MKIGILSMQRILNYGSFMQSLALKNLINSLGHEVVMVDYTIEPTIYDRNNRIKRIKQKLKNIKTALKGMPILRQLMKKRWIRKNKYRTLAFDDCYNLLNMNQARHYRTKADVLIIGSDEVFNCLQSNPDVGYSLELFGKNNRAGKLISYAASFGHTTMEGLEQYGVKDEITCLLKKFDSISVRDEYSKKIIRQLCEYEPMCHSDPVLIGELEKQDWKNINESNYIIVYGYEGRFTEDEGLSIKNFSKKRGLKVISLGGKQSFADTDVICRPDEVLSYFKNADYIITDTFHGSIFSIIYHKQFVAFCRRKDRVKAGYATNEEKLVDMLSKMGLMNRLIDSPDEIEKIIDNPIDYIKTEHIRSRERERTIQYLKTNLT